jgi:hypothetical protein
MTTSFKEVYRIQDNNGRGPFKPGFTETWIKEQKNTSYFRISELNKLRKIKNKGCGCLSLSDLKKWFTKEEYQNLKKLGYICVKMKGKILLKNSDQVVFSKTSKLSLNKEILELYED